MDKTIFQCLKSGHDSNGNMRSIYIEFFTDGTQRAVYMGGYNVPEQLRKNSIRLPDINVTNKELRSWIKMAKDSTYILWYD